MKIIRDYVLNAIGYLITLMALAFFVPIGVAIVFWILVWCMKGSFAVIRWLGL